jgi:hypothetical protein
MTLFQIQKSPYRAPFKNKPKSAVFLQTDDFNKAHKGPFLPRSHLKRVFGRSRKKVPKKGLYGPIMGILWGSILAYFGE